MDYKQRFNKIVEKIGERRKLKGQGEIKKIEGIDKIYDGGNGFISITAKELEITRGHGGGIYTLEFSSSKDNWEILENLTEKIKEWFSYVEEKVDTCVPDKVVVDGRIYKLVE